VLARTRRLPFIDGLHLGEHLMVVALAITTDGRKVPVGLYDGDTENTTVVTGRFGTKMTLDDLATSPAPTRARPRVRRRSKSALRAG
jgi:hypothetical protein